MPRASTLLVLGQPLLGPGPPGGHALEEYLERLSFGTVFARNLYGESVVVAAGIGEDNTLSVLCNTQAGIKNWTLTKVFFEGEGFCHESGGMFFTLQALKGPLSGHRRKLPGIDR